MFVHAHVRGGAARFASAGIAALAWGLLGAAVPWCDAGPDSLVLLAIGAPPNIAASGAWRGGVVGNSGDTLLNS
jgi:hypothetical protein